MLIILFALFISMNVAAHDVSAEAKIVSVDSNGVLSLELRGKAPFFISKQVLCNEYKLAYSNVFIVEDVKGNSVKYVWVEEQLSNLHDPVNFIHVKDKYSCKFDLGELYDLKTGGEYTVTYRVWNPEMHGEKEIPSYQLKSNTFRFTLN